MAVVRPQQECGKSINQHILSIQAMVTLDQDIGVFE
jgi:hypothetical protein